MKITHASSQHQIAPFCQVIRSDPSCAEKCHQCDAQACEVASRKRSIYTYRCHAGLMESITPVILGNIVIGYLLFGHVFSYSSHEEGWEQIKRFCQDYPIHKDSLKSACFQQPLIANDYINSASHIMQAVSAFLCLEQMATLRQQELPVQIDNYIHAHFTENINTMTIARHFGIGKTRLYEIAKENYGIGIAECIRNLRIDKAMQLLKEQPGLSLAEIASLCGFSDYNYFITVFKRIVGVPPKIYANIG